MYGSSGQASESLIARPCAHGPKSSDASVMAIVLDRSVLDITQSGLAVVSRRHAGTRIVDFQIGRVLSDSCHAHVVRCSFASIRFCGVPQRLDVEPSPVCELASLFHPLLLINLLVQGQPVR